MIKLIRNPSPEALQRLEKLKERWKDCDRKNEPIPELVKIGYRDKKVKASIRQETCDKCAYCESKVSHIDFGDVEHIIPKSKDPINLTLDYNNLTYACSICNNSKLDYYDKNNPLINPYLDNPEDHLIAFGEFIWKRPGEDRGEITEKRLKLNRPHLLEKRLERLKSVARLADSYAKTTGELKSILKQELLAECDRAAEYSFVVRALLVSYGI